MAAVIEYVTREAAPDPVGKVYDQMSKATGGIVPNIARAMAHNPGLFQAFLGVNLAYEHMDLDARLRELAYVAVSRKNGCDYCAHYHVMFGKKAGLSERQLAEVGDFENSDAYDALQKDVIRYAVQVGAEVNPDPALVARLKETLSDRELMELTFAVALASFTNRFNVALGIELP